MSHLAAAQGWTGGWGEAWLWLSAHRGTDNSTWRWDWVERPRDGGHISGARLEGTSGKKVTPDPRSLTKIEKSASDFIFSGKPALIQAATGHPLLNRHLVWSVELKKMMKLFLQELALNLSFAKGGYTPHHSKCH